MASTIKELHVIRQSPAPPRATPRFLTPSPPQSTTPKKNRTTYDWEKECRVVPLIVIPTITECRSLGRARWEGAHTRKKSPSKVGSLNKWR